MKRKLNFSRYLSLIILISAVSITKSYSAGFATDSHSASGLATSYSGAVTGSHDISDSFFNPAIFGLYALLRGLSKKHSFEEQIYSFQ